MDGPRPQTEEEDILFEAAALEIAEWVLHAPANLVPPDRADNDEIVLRAYQRAVTRMRRAV